MAKFRYAALRDDGEHVIGEIEGTDRSAVLGRLNEQGLHPIDLYGLSNVSQGDNILGVGRRIASDKEISIFTRELGWLLQAGMTLNAALEILARENVSTRFSALIAGLRADIRKGTTFRDALATARVFPPYYLSMVEVGEASGTLPAVLERISATRDREQKIRNKLISALIYPSLLVALATGAVTFIMVSVVPSIKDMITSTGAPVPESARFVIATSDWIIAHGMTLLAAVPLAILAIVMLAGNRSTRGAFKSAATHLPLIGGLIRKAAAVQFCRMLGTLLGAGVGLPDSLKLMRAASVDRRISSVIGDMQVALRQGENFIRPLERSKLFPSILARMMGVGNETGNLAQSVQQVTGILEEELEHQMERTLTLVEPSIILALSAAVAFIITSLMSAIISINDLAI